MTEKKIDIAQVIGTSNAILQRFGLQIKDLVLSEKKNHERIVLDFSNLDNATTGFFHASIGNLKKELNGSFVKTVGVTGLEKNDTWQDKYDDAIDFAKDSEKSKAIDEAIEELFD